MHIIYDTTQVTSPENGSNPQPEDPCHPLVKNGHVPLLIDTEPEFIRYRCKIEGKYMGNFFTYEDAENEKSGVYYSDGVHHFFYWQNGNFSCDCNRARFLLPTMICGYDPNDFPCGEKIRIQRIIPIDNIKIPEIPLCELEKKPEVGPQSFSPAHYTRNFGQHGTAGTAGTLKKRYSDSSPHIIQPLGDNEDGNERVSDTLTANKSMTTSTYGDIALHNKVMVRRLTPKECGRLQGFPDGYLEQVPGFTDSKAYSAFGNSMTVQVMAWIGNRIDKVDKLMKGMPNSNS